uniref:Ig-like domain-containing protein n=1 Tax=Esox lucius TaxID=8010 RepID=A0A6Q2XCD0_ESOLU
MINLLIHVVTLLLWVTGLSQTDQVHQTPTAILKQPGDEVQLTCNHTNTNYDMILWYQQSEQRPALKLIGNVRYTKATMEDSFKEHFNMSGDASAGKTKLETGDRGMYFCAVSEHSDTEDKYSCTKTPVSVVIRYNIIQIDEGLIMYCRGTSNSTNNNV